MTARAVGAYENHPAKYFTASPTFFYWNALTAHDVHHTLQTRAVFEGQNLYFILNHPIKFVRLVGLIVDIELLGNGKYLILTIDDGSGSTIECKTERRLATRPDEPQSAGRVKTEWPSNTLIDNLDVHIELGLARLEIDRRPIDIGTVVKAKGTIDTFRKQRQLKLDRIRIVTDTNEEAKAWQECADWKASMLSKPWVLTEAEKTEVDLKLAEGKAKETERSKKKRVKDAKYAEKKRLHEEKKEKRRKVLEGRFDEGALGKSRLLPGDFSGP